MTWSSEYNATWVLVAFILWIFAFFRCKPWIDFRKPARNAVNVSTTWFFVILFTLSVLGLHRWDTYHMVERFMTKSYMSYEPVYRWIALFSKNDYLMFRLIVFGGATLLYWSTSNLLRCKNRNFLLVCSIILLDSMFCEMRGVLGHCILLLGFVLLIIKRNVLLKILGILLIFVSFFFHKSIFIAIIAGSLAYFISMGRKTLVISWMFFPILVIIVSFLMEGILSGSISLEGFSDEMNIEGASVKYASKEEQIITFNGWISVIVTNIYKFLIFFYLSYKLALKKIRVDAVNRFFFRWYYICTYLGALVYFSDPSGWISQRIMIMGIFPLTFVLSDVWNKEKKSNLWIKSIIVFGFISVTWSLMLRMVQWEWY